MSHFAGALCLAIRAFFKDGSAFDHLDQRGLAIVFACIAGDLVVFGVPRVIVRCRIVGAIVTSVVKLDRVGFKVFRRVKLALL